MPKNSVCAEIGVNLGEFSGEIMNVVRPSKIHLIDLWEGYPDFNKNATTEIMDARYKQVLKKFDKEIVNGLVEIHKVKSNDAYDIFDDNYFDFVYIDANHRYEYVIQDLLGFLPKVKVNGMISGDDYGTTGWWEDGVTKAVSEFSRRADIEPIEGVHTKQAQFAFRKIK
jgi:hypothetical protein